MISATPPKSEPERLKALFDYQVLDTPTEECFEELTELAAFVCHTPIVLVSLIDENRQWFKSHRGLGASETPREYAFCSHAILQDGIFEIPDSTKDERFYDNPLVTGEPKVIFYAGAPLKTPTGHNLGTLCVIDNKPGKLSEQQKRQLQLLAKQVVTQLELRKNNRLREELFNELVEHTEKVTQKNQELAQFATRAAHDLQAPVRQITAFTQLAREDLAANNIEAATNKYAFIKQSCTNLHQLIHNIFELTKSEVMKTTPTLIDFNSLIKKVLLEHQQEIDNHKINIVYQVDTEQDFYGEQIRLEQILANLLSNSIKYYNPEAVKSHIEITITSEGEGVQLVVDDNGLGIPETLQHKLYMPFERLHPKVAYGSGLGTTIVKKHIDAMNGRIDFTSTEQGTVFTIYLPNNIPEDC